MDALESLCDAVQAELGVTMTALEGREGIVLMDIERDNGKPGSGKVALERLCVYADATGASITLGVLDHSAKLVALYESIGFGIVPAENEEDGGLYMTRPPRAPREEIPHANAFAP